MGDLSEYKGFILEEEDIPFEEDILRNPYSVKAWWRYLEHKRTASRAVRNMIYERALKEIPGSYKLWYAYLRERRKAVRHKCATDPAYEDLNNAYERCLVFMHKMPRMWIDYCSLMVNQAKITRTRHTFDRALRALPITQHHRIWPMYLKFVRQHAIPETAVRVYRRYLKLEPSDVEDYIEYLVSIHRLDEAAIRLASVVNDDKFVSKKGKSQHQLWTELCEMISKHATDVTTVKAEPIIRAGIKRFSDMVGRLWVALADYFIRQGHFGKARDVFEEAVQTVMTVRDFSQVFDAYAQFEESMITLRMEETGEEDDVELDMCMARFEALMDRRPILLNSVLLRQNPHNVPEWLKRAQLFEDRPHLVIHTYTEAVQTVDPLKAVGKVCDLWVNFAKYYEQHEQLDEARAVFDKAVTASYRKVDELAAVWCEYAEMEIRHGNTTRALSLARQATSQQSYMANDDQNSIRGRLHRSLKVWSLYVDLEESLGTFESAKAVYDRIMDLRIATPQIVINYAMFLEENKYFEEAFKVYERGLGLFKWPYVFDLWITYINKFVERYGGSKLERARDLFEQALDGCPAKYAKELYYAYAKLEEDYGLARHAMAVYDRATKAVAPEERMQTYKRYIRKAAELFGVTKTRDIYQAAIEALQDKEASTMCQEYATLEIKLGEIDRARALFNYGSQFCDPRVATEYWQAWREFEVKHGNEDTFRDMLRIKRSVEAVYMTKTSADLAAKLAKSQQQGFVAAQSTSGPNGTANSMQRMEAEHEDPQEEGAPKVRGVQFVSSRTELGAMPDGVGANPSEIEIGDSGSEDEGEEDDGENKREPASKLKVEQKSIPSAVFGSLKA
eukprot:comp23760_c1_seq1/m.41135 comp23760_c1_seq1/g.41135  ORF comp23760_c1_seq1/g.41135 comp23760_c1_seq1/m.41135 type:complete len:846 (-) comp23760_c1_seq1:271-2808(-)